MAERLAPFPHSKEGEGNVDNGSRNSWFYFGDVPDSRETFDLLYVM